MSEKLVEADFIGAGFKKVEHTELAHPPKINWDEIFKDDWSMERQFTYAKKLAESMNHAADTIQKERDELLALCERKEKQLVSMKKAVDANNFMMQQQMTKFNEDRQLMNEAHSTLMAEVRQLRKEAAQVA